jgi:hypothetical protein
MLELDKARKELSEKNLNQIQRETAITWASRAAISFENCVAAQDGMCAMACWSLGEEYFHEACEHAALVTEDAFIGQIKNELVPYQDKAAEAMNKLFSSKV